MEPDNEAEDIDTPTEAPDEPTEAPQNDGASSISETVVVDEKLVDVMTEANEFAEDLVKIHELVNLRETAEVQRSGSIWEVIVIREGLSLNRRYYSREVLEESLPLWEGEDVCIYGYDPHRSRDHVPNTIENALPAGTYANKAGFLRNVSGRMVEGRFCIVAEFVVTRESLRKELLETYKHNGRMPGFSIHAAGESEPGICEGGHKCHRVTKITETKELTLVSKPAAGGTATRLIAGQETTENTGGTDLMDLTKVRAFVAGKQTVKALAEAVENMDDKALMESAAGYLKEMEGCRALVELAMDFLAAGNADQALAALEKALGAAEAAPAPAEVEEMDDEPVYEGRAQKEVRRPDESALSEAVKAAEAKVAAFEKRAQLRECASILKAKLADSKLPEAHAKIVNDRFAGKVFTESELDGEIAQMSHLVESQRGGDAKIENTGPSVQVLVEAGDRVQPMMDLYFKVDWRKDESLTESEKAIYKELEGAPQTRSIRELYKYASGDHYLKNSGRRGSLTEAVTTSTFSNLLDTSITRKVHADFTNMPDADWKPFVAEVSAETLQQQDRSLVGGIGMIPVVAEGGTYTDLGQPVEYTSNFSHEKRGGYVSITEEAILNDKNDRLQNIPLKLRNAALEAEKTLVYKALIGNLGGSGINTDTSYTGAVHYIANHDNYGTGALSNATLIAARLMQKRQMVVAAETALDDATDIDDTDTAIVVDDATGIRVGMYIRIDAEFMEVTGVSSNTLTCVRGARGSTAILHLDNAKVFAYSGMLPWAAAGGFSMNVIVPTELEDEAFVALASQFVPGGGNNDLNKLYPEYTQGKINIVAVDSIYLGGDTTNWYTAAPYQVAPGLEFSYLDGHREPKLVNATQDLSEQVFLADTMRFKIKHRIGANNMNHEGRTGHIVAG